MTSKDLKVDEYNSYYQSYLSKTNDVTLKDGLLNNSEAILIFLNNIPEDKHEYRYAEGKWTIKEMLLHIIDTERIFSYRALRIARQDTTPMPGYNQDAYVPPSKANERTFQSLINEYQAVRQSTIMLFNSFSEEMLLQIGTASDFPISVRALGFILIGHENHHSEIIRERYLKSFIIAKPNNN
jgi:uncharacterized damage-inducible protein DinB